MPTYEYACSSCAHEWEAEQSIKDAPLTDCPSCKGPTAKRQISRGTGFILKGSGWYSDLYAGSSNKAPEKKPDAAGSSPGGDKGGSKAGDSSAAGASSTPSSTPSSSSTSSAAAA
jgi:putative FmdB family regulatory protein